MRSKKNERWNRTGRAARHGGAWILALVLVASGIAGAASSDAYRDGVDAMNDGHYEQALEAFRAAVEQGHDKSDAALYWQMDVHHRLGNYDRALRIYRQLRHDHPDSSWLDDAEKLEARIRAAAGEGTRRPVHAEDCELKLIAVESLLRSDPERGTAALNRFLRGDCAPDVKERALFLLLHSGTARGMEIAAELARDDTAPRGLRESALNLLGLYGDERSHELLSEIYESTGDVETRRRILQGFMLAGREDRLLAAAREESSVEIRAEAVQQLGLMGATDELDQLLRTESSLEVKQAILEAFMIAGEKDRLLAAARDDESPELRRQAIQQLGVLGATAELSELYGSEASVEVKEAMLNAFMITGESDSLLEAARNESSPRLRETAIHLLGVMDAHDGLWDLFQQERNTHIKRVILEALFMSGQHERIADVARSDEDPEIRALAVQSLGMSKTETTEDLLVSIYGSEKERRVREAVLHALHIQGNVPALIRIARGETDPELKAQAVRMLALTDSAEAKRFMLEVLDE